MRNSHSNLLRVAMVAAFSAVGVEIPKLVDGKPTIVDLPRDLAAKVINGQRGKVAPAAAEVNFKLESKDVSKDSQLHQHVSGENAESGGKLKPPK